MFQRAVIICESKSLCWILQFFTLYYLRSVVSPSAGVDVFSSSYQLSLFGGDLVLLLHLLRQIVDLLLQFADGVAHHHFIPEETHHSDLLQTVIRWSMIWYYTDEACVWPLLGSQCVLQFFGFNLGSGDRVHLHSVILELLHLSAQIPQLNTPASASLQQIYSRVTHTHTSFCMIYKLVSSCGPQTCPHKVTIQPSTDTLVSESLLARLIYSIQYIIAFL